MPFGLCNAAQSFQRFIDEGLRGVYAYIDDVLIASYNEEEHKQHIRQVLQRFHEHGVINPTKCEFGKQELVFLGHLVNHDGIRPLPDKVKTLKGFPQPTKVA